MVYTVKGSWRYLEHDWTAVPGSFVYETAASKHTPVVPGVGHNMPQEVPGLFTEAVLSLVDGAWPGRRG